MRFGPLDPRERAWGQAPDELVTKVVNEQQQTIFMQAAAAGHTDAVMMMLAICQSQFSRNRDGNRVGKGDEGAKLKPTPPACADAVDEKKRNALSYAAVNGHYATAWVLVNVVGSDQAIAGGASEEVASQIAKMLEKAEPLVEGAKVEAETLVAKRAAARARAARDRGVMSANKDDTASNGHFPIGAHKLTLVRGPDGCGFRLYTNNLKACSVGPAAYNRGVREGQRILAVNGYPIENYTQYCDLAMAEKRFEITVIDQEDDVEY